MQTSKYICFFCLFALLVCASGCGNQVKVSGKVLYSDDKSPVTQGTIKLTDGKFAATGSIKPDGTYTVGSVKANDGLPPGEYKVYIIGAEKMETAPGGGLPMLTYTIDRKYEKAETSGLTLKVEKSMTHDFELDRYKK